MEYNYILSPKTVPDIMAFHNILERMFPTFLGITMDQRGTVIILTENPTDEIITQIESITPPNASAQSQVQMIISNAINFGNKLIVEFATENVIMGITQDNMTKIVRQRMSEVINALQTGSLYDAINEAKAIPDTFKDGKYITNTRLLQFINKIETYLNLPRSNSL